MRKTLLVGACAFVLGVGTTTYVFQSARAAAPRSETYKMLELFGPDDWRHSTGDLAPTHSPITIGQGVFVGARALILEGVTIGNHAVIGAGAIVVRDVPPLAIAVGCPAKVVAYRDMPMRVWTVAGMIDLKGEVLQDVSSAPSCPAFSTHDAF